MFQPKKIKKIRGRFLVHLLVRICPKVKVYKIYRLVGTEKVNTKFMEDILAVGFLEAFLNQIAIIGKERPVISYRSL